MLAEVEVTLLLTRLRSYSAALDRHTLAIQKAHDKVRESYDHLRRVWGGDAAQEFFEHWDRTTEAFKRYLEGSRRIRVVPAFSVREFFPTLSRKAPVLR